MKKIGQFIVNGLKSIIKCFYSFCTVLAKGFFFFPKQFFLLLKKIFKNSKTLDKIVKHYEKRQLQPEFCLLFILYFLVACTLINILYIRPNHVVHNFDIYSGQSTNDSVPHSVRKNTTIDLLDDNPYRKFARTKLEDVNLEALEKKNSDTVAWISVDGTSINYPVVQSTDNDYYLKHSFMKSKTLNGWIFMDYRNNPYMEDKNTVFYGHNLPNKTAFGSLENIFTKDWLDNSNKSIIILNGDKKYYYRVFSAYYTTPEVYYLQRDFNSLDEYKEFLKTIVSRNILDIDTEVTVSDQIITLSTCNDGSSGRKVVHAKLIKTYL